MVSIVITAYNRERFIRECVDSALAQDYAPLEVIVVDSSIDQTPQICGEYGVRIRYFWMPAQGCAAAKNLGIRESRGEWIKLLDSDDVLERTAISTFIACAKRSKAELLCCDYSDIDESGRPLRTKPHTRLKGDEFRRWCWCWRNGRRNLVVGGGYCGIGFVSRNLLLTVGLAEDIQLAEDREWELRAAIIHGCCGEYVPLSLYRSRHHPARLTSSFELHFAEREEMVRAMIRMRLASPSEVPPIVREHYQEDVRRLRRAYFPILPMVWLARNLPFYGMLRRLAWDILPYHMDRLYWVLYPPVNTAGARPMTASSPPFLGLGQL